MRILILGGTRFVGPHVVRELVAGGHSVLVFHRGDTENPLSDEAEHLHGDFADFGRHLPALRAFRPHVLIDMQAMQPADGRRVVAFKGVARRAIVASSADVYRAFGRLHRTEPGPPDSLPLTEDSPLRKSVITEDSDKVGMEREAQSDPQFPVTVLRLPAIHGPGDYQHRLYQYVKRMDDGRPAILLDRSVASWRWVRGYVEDVAHAVALAAADERPAGRVYNVADAAVFSEADWVQQIARVHGWAGKVIAVSPELLPSGLRQSEKYDFGQHYVVDSSRIRRDLGYSERVEPKEALRRTIAWERENAPAELDPSQWDYAAEDAAFRVALH